jgi:hypothetical protein
MKNVKKNILDRPFLFLLSSSLEGGEWYNKVGAVWINVI